MDSVQKATKVGFKCEVARFYSLELRMKVDATETMSVFWTNLTSCYV